MEEFFETQMILASDKADKADSAEAEQSVKMSLGQTPTIDANIHDPKSLRDAGYPLSNPTVQPNRHTKPGARMFAGRDAHDGKPVVRPTVMPEGNIQTSVFASRMDPIYNALSSAENAFTVETGLSKAFEQMIKYTNSLGDMDPVAAGDEANRVKWATSDDLESIGFDLVSNSERTTEGIDDRGLDGLQIMMAAQIMRGVTNFESVTSAIGDTGANPEQLEETWNKAVDAYHRASKGVIQGLPTDEASALQDPRYLAAAGIVSDAIGDGQKGPAKEMDEQTLYNQGMFLVDMVKGNPWILIELVAAAKKDPIVADAINLLLDADEGMDLTLGDFGRGVYAAALDFTSYAGIGLVGHAMKGAARTTAVRLALKKAGLVGAEGAGFAGTYTNIMDHGFQNIDILSGRQEEFSISQNAKMTGIGVGAGFVFGSALSGLTTGATKLLDMWTRRQNVKSYNKFREDSAARVQARLDELDADPSKSYTHDSYKPSKELQDIYDKDGSYLEGLYPDESGGFTILTPAEQIADRKIGIIIQKLDTLKGDKKTEYLNTLNPDELSGVINRLEHEEALNPLPGETSGTLGHTDLPISAAEEFKNVIPEEYFKWRREIRDNLKNQDDPYITSGMKDFLPGDKEILENTTSKLLDAEINDKASQTIIDFISDANRFEGVNPEQIYDDILTAMDAVTDTYYSSPNGSFDSRIWLQAHKAFQRDRATFIELIKKHRGLKVIKGGKPSDAPNDPDHMAQMELVREKQLMLETHDGKLIEVDKHNIDTPEGLKEYRKEMYSDVSRRMLEDFDIVQRHIEAGDFRFDIDDVVTSKWSGNKFKIHHLKWDKKKNEPQYFVTGPDGERNYMAEWGMVGGKPKLEIVKSAKDEFGSLSDAMDKEWATKVAKHSDEPWIGVITKEGKTEFKNRADGEAADWHHSMAMTELLDEWDLDSSISFYRPADAKEIVIKGDAAIDPMGKGKKQIKDLAIKLKEAGTPGNYKIRIEKMGLHGDYEGEIIGTIDQWIKRL